MCLDEENNIKRILGSEPIASRPLPKDEIIPEAPHEKASAQDTEQPVNSQNNTEQEKEPSQEQNTPPQDTQNEAFIPPALTASQKSDPEENQMPLLSHLNELRQRLTRIVIIVLIGFIGFYGISELAYTYLAEPLTRFLPEGSTLIYTSPQGAFFTYLKVALMLSILGTSPYTFYQIWAFIAPGLYKEEQKAVLPLAFFSAFFFLAGAAFCYVTVFPIAFKFFMGFTTDMVRPMISVEEYLSFALKLIIAFGLVFEMPLFSYFLARLRLISADGMRRYRKYAILVIFITAAILTPPDVFSQVLMAIPMIFLYEVSIYITKVASRTREKNEKKEMQEENEQSEQSTEVATEQAAEPAADTKTADLAAETEEIKENTQAAGNADETETIQQDTSK